MKAWTLYFPIPAPELFVYLGSQGLLCLLQFQMFDNQMVNQLKITNLIAHTNGSLSLSNDSKTCPF